MFKAIPGIVPIESRPDLWYLDGPLVWKQADVIVTIPAGFITDDASIPKFLDWLRDMDRQGLSRLPGLLHDGIYSLGRSRPKAWADNVLREACLVEGMSRIGAACIYYGVHWFGASSYAGDANHGAVDPATEGDFISADFYNAFKASGSSIYSQAA